MVKGCKIKFRIWVAILMFFICCTFYLLRVNFSIIAIAISAPINLTGESNGDCQLNYTKLSDHDLNQKHLNPLMLGIVLGAYDLGYCLSIMFYRILGPALGPTIAIGYSAMISSGFTVLTFMAYKFSVFMLIVLRLFIGFLAGSLMPLLNILIVQWSPLNERNLFGTVLLGCSVGISITFPLSGYIIKHYSARWVIYVSGIFALVLSVLWLTFVRDEPEMHKCVSDREKNEIMVYRGQRSVSHDYPHIRKQVPWPEIFKSSPFRALFILMWANTWVMCFYMNYIPLYFYQFLGYDIMEATLFAAVPFAARLVFGIMCMPMVKFFLMKRHLPVGTTRKLFTCFSHILPGFIELGLLFFVCNKTVNTIKAIVVLGLNGAVIGGGLVNTADLMPHYTGSVTAAMQSVLCLSGALMSCIAGFVLKYYDGRPKAWTILLAFNALWYLIGGIVFLIFGSGRVQPWDIASMRRNVFHGFVAEDEPSSD